MERGRRSGPMAICTRVSVGGGGANHDCIPLIDAYCWFVQGSFVYGEREGFGTYVSLSGLEYEGEWKYNKPNGKGKETSPNGDMYEGEWKGDANHHCIP